MYFKTLIDTGTDCFAVKISIDTLIDFMYEDTDSLVVDLDGMVLQRPYADELLKAAHKFYTENIPDEYNRKLNERGY